MTVKELASKMNELMRDGKSNNEVRVTTDGGVTNFPINMVQPYNSIPDFLKIGYNPKV